MTVRGTARGSFGTNSNQFFGPLICSLIETNTLSGVNPSGWMTFSRNKVGLRSFIAGHKRSGTRMAEPDKKLALIEEQLVIYKRAVSDGRVRVSTKTEFVQKQGKHPRQRECRGDAWHRTKCQKRRPFARTVT